MEKTPDFKQLELRWGEILTQSFIPSCPKGNKSIIMPPPNVTGSLHIGHALTYSLQDVWIRFWRMQGFDVLAQPGLDHAGIATQMMVEKHLAQKGVSRQTLGREGFLKEAFAFKETAGQTILSQMKRLGVAANWDRLLFTLDEPVEKAVRLLFCKLYDEGLIYQSERLVHFDIHFQTALSNLEVLNKEVKGHLWTLRYPLKDAPNQFVDIATTRPETLFGDQAVAVHPKDERYQHLIGKKVLIPLIHKEIPLIAHEAVEPDKGTGALKVTPAHDFVDFEIGKAHKLPFLSVIDLQGKLNQNVPTAFQGLDRLQVRPEVLKALESEKALISETSIVHTLPHGDRSNTLLEPQLTKQWFLDVKPLAEKALKASQAGNVRFIPSTYQKTYERWLENIEPWCLSRQLWWGHTIPAFYGPCGKAFVAINLKDAQEKADLYYGKPVTLRSEEDVLDTWFSSALWPFITMGWPKKTSDLKAFYPTSVLVTGFDIIFFWVARMVMMGIYATDDVPFGDVMIHGLVRDENRQKMSKTKGNVVDPLEVLHTYGPDALRLTLTALSTPGADLSFSTARVIDYRNFLTKFWNASRFMLSKGVKHVKKIDRKNMLHPLNGWLYHHLGHTVGRYLKAMKAYHFYEAVQIIYHFVWDVYCDLYIEMTKSIWAAENENHIAETQEVAGYALGLCLQMLYPFAPFITSEIASYLKEAPSQLHETLWSAEDLNVDSLEKDFHDIQRLILWIQEIRHVRSELQIPFKTPLKLSLKAIPEYLKQNQIILSSLLGLTGIQETEASVQGPHIQGIVDQHTYALPLEKVISAEEEKERLSKKLINLKAERKKLEAKLHNPLFQEKAPKKLLSETKERYQDLSQREEALAKIVNHL